MSVALLGAASVVAGSALPSCYSTGDGTAPHLDEFYFPVGLAVSPPGDVLWVVNSDFDLQYNGGTVQAYDLTTIRANIFTQLLKPCDVQYPTPGSPSQPDLGQTCAPPTDARPLVQRAVAIGAFATDLQIAKTGNRLYIPVRGDTTLTWIDTGGGGDKYALDCGQDTDPKAGSLGGGRCNGDDSGDRAQQVNSRSHLAGRVSDPQNTRGVTMPGEPFGMAQSADGTSIVITHQNDTKTSLFSTGETPTTDPADGPVTSWTRTSVPSIQFVLDGVPVGGNGIAAIPHDTDALDKDLDKAKKPLRDAYLQTSRAAAEIDLVRYYPDMAPDGTGSGVDPNSLTSSLHRPFLQREAAFPVVGNASGIDSRGILIDDTPRRACKLALGNNASAEDKRACARLGARVFVANRSPASLLRGEIGNAANSVANGTYDPDHLVMYGTEPLTEGPSRMYLAPIIDRDGHYVLRLFIVCFDSATIFIWDPVAGQLENIVRVDQGPFAMAFDPFNMDDVASRKLVADADNGDPATHAGEKYAFAYIASFTKSFVQVIDLDQRRPQTFEKVVYTLGQPTFPKGTN